MITSYGGGGFTEAHRAALRLYGTQRVLVAYDADEAGDRDAEHVADELTRMGIECYRVHFPRGLDANAYAQQVVQLGVRWGQEREADVVTICCEISDPDRVLCISLQGLTMRDLLPSLGVRGKNRDNLEPRATTVAQCSQILRECEAIHAGELDSYQDLVLLLVLLAGPEIRTDEIVDELHGTLEAQAGRSEEERFRIGPAVRSNDHRVLELTCINSDHCYCFACALASLVRSFGLHRTLLVRVSDEAQASGGELFDYRPSW